MVRVHLRGWARAALRVLAVLGICAGVGLGVVSPSQAATGPRWVPGAAFTDSHTTVTLQTPVLGPEPPSAWPFWEVSLTYSSVAESGYAGAQFAIRLTCRDAGGQDWSSVGVYVQPGSRTATFSCANGSTVPALVEVMDPAGSAPLAAFDFSGATSPAPDGTQGACRPTDTELAMLARGAGWSGSSLTTAVAVALAESGGVVNATNHNSDGSWDLGLWQVNDEAHGLSETDRAAMVTNPAANAATAYGVWQAASGFGPWVAYSTGRHTKFMQRAAAAVAASGDAELRSSSCAGFAAYAGEGNPADGEADACAWGWNLSAIGRCLFVPSSGAVEDFTSLGDDLEGAFPFGYVSAGLHAAWRAASCFDADSTNGGLNDACGAPRLVLDLPTGGELEPLAKEGPFVSYMQAHRAFVETVIWLSFALGIAAFVYRRLFPVVNE